MGSLSHAVGVNQLWGASPSSDLQDAWYLCPETGERGEASGAGRAALDLGGDGVHALMMGAADPRHVVHTVALAGRWKARPLSFYVVEETPEAVARQLLLTLVTLQRDTAVEARAQLFLELLGNLRLRERTAALLRESLVPQLLRALGGGEGADAGGGSELGRMLDLSHLKYSEADELERAARRWAAPRPEVDLPALWDHRLRAYYADRYDSREAAADWDYRMRGVQAAAPVLHSIHYRAWRSTGQAFELRECEYAAPNPTLVTSREAVQRGRGPVRVRGYWGDIVVTPYVSLGAESQEAACFEVRQTQHTRTAADVAEFNLCSWLCEWQLGTRHELPPIRLGPPRGAEGEGQHADTKGVEAEPSTGAKSGDAGGAAVRIVPLPSDARARVFGRGKYRGLFNRAFVAHTHAHLIGPALNATLRAGAIITVETMRHLPLRNDARTAYINRVCDLADSAGWVPCAVRGDGKAARPGPAAVRLAFRYPGAKNE